MLVGKRRALAEAWHIGTQVVHPHVIGAVLILMWVRHRAFGEEQHVGLHALRVKNTGRQAQNGVQMRELGASDEADLQRQLLEEAFGGVKE